MHILVAHALIDIVVAAIALNSGTRDISMAEITIAGGLVGGQMLLLAAWIGFSDAHPRNKFSISCIGCAFLSFVTTACGGYHNLSFSYGSQSALLVTVSVALLAVLFGLSRRFVMRPVPVSDQQVAGVFQFSTRSILTLMTLVALAFGVGHLIRSLGGEALGMFVVIGCIVVFGGTAMLWLLWAGLGIPKPTRRLVGAIIFTTMLGTIPPAYLGGPNWRFLAWPALTFSLSIVVALTLITLRSRTSLRFALIASPLVERLSVRHVAK